MRVIQFEDDPDDANNFQYICYIIALSMMTERSMNEWQRLYKNTHPENPIRGCRIITAYNEVVDKIYKLRDEDIQQLPSTRADRTPQAILNKIEDFAAVLDFSLRNGIASEMHASDELFEYLESRYDFIPRIGGQAAIIGSIISRFSDHPAIIHPDRVDELLGNLLREENLLAPIISEGRIKLVGPHEIGSELRSERHLIFEFAEGQPAITGGACKRHNRIIVDPVSAIQIDPSFEKALPEISRTCDLFLVAGLNHMGEDYDSAFKKVASHARIVRDSNPDAILHLEITSMADKEKMDAMVKEIIPLFDSIGLNETELQTLSAAVGSAPVHLGRKFTLPEQVEAMNALLRLGVRRIHMHTLGYYLRAGETGSVISSIRALIFSAAVVCAAAINGRMPYPEDLKTLSFSPSEKGFKAAESLSDQLIHSSDGSEIPEGRAEGIICVPTPIIENPRLTVGLGDCISGTCVAAEKMMKTI